MVSEKWAQGRVKGSGATHLLHSFIGGRSVLKSLDLVPDTYPLMALHSTPSRRMFQ